MSTPQKILLHIAVLTVALTCHAQDPTRINRIAQHYTDRDEFSGTVTFAHAGKVIFRHGYGFADHENKTRFDEHTLFNIGSLTKQFTAAAILLLQQDGELKTSDPLGKFLPAEIPPAWSPITIRQLLTHTSGIEDYAGIAPLTIQSQEHPTADLLAIVRDAPLDFKPGEGFLYSNTNYLLLAMLVQKVSGTPFCAFLHQRFFAPLAMRDTACLSDIATGFSVLTHHAIGYTPSDPGDAKPLTQNLSAPPIAGTLFFGAGNLVSTGDDLVRWSFALHHGQVLSADSYREMTTPARNNYAYGLGIDTLRNHVRISHEGSVPGFFCLLDYFPGTDNLVVVLSNQNTPSLDMFTPGTHPIESELMTLAIEPSAPVPSERPDSPSSASVLKLLTGRYVSDGPNTLDFTVSLDGDHLQLLQQGPSHTPSELRADYGELDFYLADSEALIEFSGQNEATIYDLRYSRALAFHRVQP